jgi:hypothetical protein
MRVQPPPRPMHQPTLEGFGRATMRSAASHFRPDDDVLFARWCPNRGSCRACQGQGRAPARPQRQRRPAGGPKRTGGEEAEHRRAGRRKSQEGKRLNALLRDGFWRGSRRGVIHCDSVLRSACRAQVPAAALLSVGARAIANCRDATRASARTSILEFAQDRYPTDSDRYAYSQTWHCSS